MMNRQNMEPIMMTPGMAGYLSVNRSGRHGSSRLPNAVGSSYHSVSALISSPKCNHSTYMHECRSNQDTSAKVLADEKRFGRDLDPFHLLCDDREASTKERSRQNHD